MDKILVLGSINVDLVAKTPRFLMPGETLTGSNFFTAEGGKGANQAVALAKLGADVSLWGKVGDDLYGREYLSYLKNLHIDATGVEIVKDCSTGIAFITLTDDGQNSIAIIAGANGRMDEDYVAARLADPGDAKYLLLQMEIGESANFKALTMAKKKGIITIFDPAPAAPLNDAMFPLIDYITPNETETEKLTGVNATNPESARRAAALFIDKGVKTVIIKAGSQGSYLISAAGAFFAPCYRVNVADTTAAGDTFNGAFTYALALNYPPQEALLFANAAAALKIMGLGAQKSMPKSVDAILALMASQPDLRTRVLA